MNDETILELKESFENSLSLNLIIVHSCTLYMHLTDHQYFVGIC